MCRFLKGKTIVFFRFLMSFNSSIPDDEKEKLLMGAFNERVQQHLSKDRKSPKTRDQFDNSCEILFSSQDQQMISTAVISLHSLFRIEEFGLNKFPITYCQKLVDYAIDQDTHINLRENIFDFIATMCKCQQSYVHAFWKLGLHEIILEIVGDDDPPISLVHPLEILSEMLRWTPDSYSYIIGKGFLNILLEKLESGGRSVLDQIALLDSLGSICDIKLYRKKFGNNQDITNKIISVVTSYALSASNQTLQYAFGLFSKLLSCISETELINNIDINQICQKGIEVLPSAGPLLASKIGGFFTDATYESDEITLFILSKGFWEIATPWITADEPNIDVCSEFLRFTANCAFSPEEARDQLVNSNFMDIIYKVLLEGELKLKVICLEIFQHLLQASINNVQLGQLLFDKYPDLMDSLCDFLNLNDLETLLRSLTCLYYAHQFEENCFSENKILFVMTSLSNIDNYDRIVFLSKYNEHDIMTIASWLLQKFSEYNNSHTG